jgi:hypothetical protein
MKARHFKAQLIAGCVAAALSSGANALALDLFTAAQGFYTDTTETAGDTDFVIASGVGGSTGTGIASILGGNRDMFVSLLESPDPDNVNATIGVSSAGVGFLSFSVDADANARGQVQWDGGTDQTTAIDYTGLMGVDLSSFGNIAVDILFSDAGFNFEITIFTDDDEFTRISFVSSAHASPTTTLIPLAAFADPTLCGDANPAPGVLLVTCGLGGEADLSNVGAIVLDLDRFGGSTSIDLRLDNITFVPEPGSVALLGAGLLGLFGLGRRFRKLA